MRRTIMNKMKKVILIVLTINLLIIPQMSYCAEDDFPPISLSQWHSLHIKSSEKNGSQTF